MCKEEKRLVWIGSSKNDLLDMPEDVQRAFGFALHLAQNHDRHESTKILKGIDSSVVEVIKDLRGNTYRVVYTSKISGTVCVLHCFQKKSKSGISTPRQDIELIKSRLKDAMIVARDEKL